MVGVPAEQVRVGRFEVAHDVTVTSATQIGELFNGDRVWIIRRQGNWYRIDADGMGGWAYAKYIRNYCGW